MQFSFEITTNIVMNIKWKFFKLTIRPLRATEAAIHISSTEKLLWKDLQN